MVLSGTMTLRRVTQTVDASFLRYRHKVRTATVHRKPPITTPMESADIRATSPTNPRTEAMALRMKKTPAVLDTSGSLVRRSTFWRGRQDCDLGSVHKAITFAGMVLGSTGKIPGKTGVAILRYYSDINAATESITWLGWYEYRLISSRLVTPLNTRIVSRPA